MRSEEDGGRPRSGAQHAALVVRRDKHEIMNRFLDTLVDVVPAARTMSRAETANHLLETLNNVERLLLLHDGNEDPVEVDDQEMLARSAILHARGRANVESYSVDQMLSEYHLLKLIVHQAMLAAEVTASGFVIVDRLLDLTSLHALSEFVRVTDQVQRKLVASLAHDIRTPLGVVKNYLELLSVTTSGREGTEAMAAINRNLKRSFAMFEQLLDFMKGGKGAIGLLLRYERADIKASVETLCQESKIIHDQPVDARLPEHPVVGVFDMAQVLRCVENLIANAVKYGAPGAPIVVALEDHDKHVEVSVHNEGPPIVSKDMEAIFTAFYSGDDKATGGARSWGIGLSLIKLVAERHGGKVSLESTEEAGTTFSMRLLKEYRNGGEEEIIPL